MANVNDYLEWRGDLSLGADPFNDVDNIILSQLSYTDFDGIVKDRAEEEDLRLGAISDIYFSMHTDQEIRSRVSFTRDAPFLMRRMASSMRFKNMRVTNYVNLIKQNATVQFSAVTFHLSDGSIYVAYRGTDTTIVGWKEDFCLSYSAETAGQKSAVEYLNMIGKAWPDVRKIRVGGHSKGGNFAVYAAACCDPEVKRRIISVYSNDAPGFLESVVNSTAYGEIRDRIRGIIPEASVFGTMFGHGFRPLIVKSSASNMFLQHDLMSWKVIGNHFEKEEQRNAGSLMFEKTFRNWLADISPEAREEFVQSVFSIFESTGALTFPEIAEQAVQNLGRIRDAVRSLPGEQQSSALDIVKRFFLTQKSVRLEELIRLLRKEQKKVEQQKRELTAEEAEMKEETNEEMQEKAEIEKETKEETEEKIKLTETD